MSRRGKLIIIIINTPGGPDPNACSELIGLVARLVENLVDETRLGLAPLGPHLVPASEGECGMMVDIHMV